MFHFVKIDDYLNFLTDKKVKDFVAINFRRYSRSISEEKNLRKAPKSLYAFPIISDEVEKFVR